MNALPYTVPLMEGETATSLASRMAAVNGVANVADFCSDMRISRVGLRSGEPEAIAGLAALAGVDRELLTRSTIVSDRPNFLIGGQRILRVYLIRPRFRMCPRCMVHDATIGNGPAAARPWFRSAWSVSLVRTCPVHRVLLQEVATPVPEHLAEDVSLVARRAADEIQKLADAAEVLPSSGLETWAAERLSGKDGGSAYLASLSFCTGMRLAEMIGATAIHGKTFAPSKLTDRDWFEAGRAGFPIVASGERSILDYLSRFHGNFARSNRGVGGRLLYGTLYPWLNFVTGEDFERVRAMIREHVVDCFPVGPGDVFLGRIDRRRWHSVQTASKECGLHPKRLKRLLQEAGFIDPALGRTSDHRVIFDAAAADAFLRQVKDTVMTREAERLAGMSRLQWAAVVEAGIVKPIVSPGRAHATYARRDIEAFLDSVAYSTGRGDPDAMVPVAKARKLATCSTTAIVGLLQARRLREVDLDPRRKGFGAILVNPEEVKAALPRKDFPGLTSTQTAERLGLNASTVFMLVARGYIRHEVSGAFSNRSGTRLVQPEEADAFALEYVSLPQAAAALGARSAKQLKARLDEIGVRPAIEKAEVGGYFYRRADISPTGSMSGRP